MRVSYLLDKPVLSGGVKVVFHHASILRRLGYSVTVIGRGARPSWTTRFKVSYCDLDEGELGIPSQDLVVASYFTTIPAAEALGLGPIVHYCQGYEGFFSWLASQHAKVEAIYARPYPVFAVTPFLADMLSERFRKRCVVVPPAVDPIFAVERRGREPRDRDESARILVPGIFECDLKGVQTGLKAIEILRKRGFNCRVVRLSTFPLSKAERELLDPEEYHRGLDPMTVAGLMEGIHLLLFPSHPQEGFGLPVLEACASGVPVVASRIPSMEYVKSLPADSDCPRLVPAGDAEAMAAAAANLLQDTKAMERNREDGFRVAERFSEQMVGEQVARAVEWAVSLGG